MNDFAKNIPPPGCWSEHVSPQSTLQTDECSWCFSNSFLMMKSDQGISQCAGKGPLHTGRVLSRALSVVSTAHSAWAPDRRGTWLPWHGGINVTWAKEYIYPDCSSLQTFSGWITLFCPLKGFKFIWRKEFHYLCHQSWLNKGNPKLQPIFSSVQDLGMLLGVSQEDRRTAQLYMTGSFAPGSKAAVAVELIDRCFELSVQKSLNRSFSPHWILTKLNPLNEGGS